MIIDMTFERREELIRRDERQEGKIEIMIAMINKGKIHIADAAEELGISEAEIKKYMSTY